MVGAVWGAAFGAVVLAVLEQFVGTIYLQLFDLAALGVASAITLLLFYF